MEIVLVKEHVFLPHQDNCWCLALMLLKESCHLIKRCAEKSLLNVFIN